MTETSTEELIAELANHAVTTVRVTAYRHHPSGVHRWFVTQFDAQGAARQIGPISQVDPIAGLELTSLDLVADVHDEELIIEWDELSDAPPPFHVSNASTSSCSIPPGRRRDRCRPRRFRVRRCSGFGESGFGESGFGDSGFDDVVFDEVTIEFGAMEAVGVDFALEASPDDTVVDIVSKRHPTKPWSRSCSSVPSTQWWRSSHSKRTRLTSR